MKKKDISKDIDRIFKFSNAAGGYKSIYNLPEDDVTKIIRKANLKITIDNVLYGCIYKKGLLKTTACFFSNDMFYYQEGSVKLVIEYDKLQNICHGTGKNVLINYHDGTNEIVPVTHQAALRILNEIISIENNRIRKYDERQLYNVLYYDYRFNKYESKEQDNLWAILQKHHVMTFDIKDRKDILGAKSFDKSGSNIIVFAKEYAAYSLGEKKTFIDYFTLKKVTYDSKTFTVYHFDGSTQTFEHSNKDTAKIANMLNRIAGIIHKDVLFVNGKTMITNENVDFDFIKFTKWQELPEDFESLEKMYLGYTSMSGDDPYYSGDAIQWITRRYFRRVDERNPAFITHDNVDYKFKKYIAGNLPKDFDSLENMYLGYCSMPTGHIEQIEENELEKIKAEMLRADLDDKYLQMQADYGLTSAKSKLKLKRVNGYKNLSSIVSEIWVEIILDYKEKVKEPCVNELRLSDGKYFTDKVSGFEILMNGLKTRAEKEIRNGEKPVAYAAYQVFNPTLKELEKSKFATYEGKPISEVLGKSPSAVDVMKLFNVPTYQFYGAMRDINPYAWLFSHSLADMQEVTTKTEYLPLSSVAEDYSLDDIKYMANYKHLRDAEYRQTGKVDANSYGAQMIRQFNEDRKIETVTKGEWYSSFYRYPCEYVFSDQPEKYSQMSYIDYLVKDHNTDARYRGYAWLKRDKNYLSFYEEMSDNGFLLFTCFLCEKGEKEVKYTTTIKFFERRDEQYAQLRSQIDAMVKK